MNPNHPISDSVYELQMEWPCSPLAALSVSFYHNRGWSQVYYARGLENTSGSFCSELHLFGLHSYAYLSQPRACHRIAVPFNEVLVVRGTNMRVVESSMSYTHADKIVKFHIQA